MRKTLIFLFLLSVVAGCELFGTTNALPVFEEQLEVSLVDFSAQLGYKTADGYTLEQINYRFNQGDEQSIEPTGGSIIVPLDGNICYGNNALEIDAKFDGPEGKVGFTRDFNFEFKPSGPSFTLSYNGTSIDNQIMVPAGEEITFGIQSSSLVKYACEALLEITIEDDISLSAISVTEMIDVPGNTSLSVITPSAEASYDAKLVAVLGDFTIEQPFTVVVESPDIGFLDIELLGPEKADIRILSSDEVVKYEGEVEDGQRIQLETGLYEVEAGDVEGFIKPDTVASRIRKGEATPLRLLYEPEQQPGTLAITLFGVEQAGVDVFDAQDVMVFNGLVNGSTTIPLAPGNYRVEAQAVAGKVTPGAKMVVITEGETSNLDLAYINFQGTIAIDLEGVPAAPIEIRDATDTIVFEGTITPGFVREVDPGTYTIIPGDVEGFEPPASSLVTIDSGITASLTLNYQAIVSNAGTLAITVTGVASAPVIVTNALSAEVFNDSVAGTASLSLEAGDYTIEPQVVTGFISPSARTVTVSKDATTPVMLNYVSTTVNTGILRINLEGVASAEVNILTDGGSFAGNFDVVNGIDIELDAGNYTVFPVQQAGTTTPVKQDITIMVNEVTTITLNYGDIGASSVNFLSPENDSVITDPVFDVTVELENPSGYQGLAFRWLREDATFKSWVLDYDPNQAIYSYEVRGLDPSLFNGNRTILAYTYDGTDWTERGRTSFVLNMPPGSRAIEFRNFPSSLELNSNVTSTTVRGDIFSVNGFEGEITLTASASNGMSAVLSPSSATLEIGSLVGLTLQVTANNVAPGSYSVTLNAADAFNDRTDQLVIPVNFTGNEGSLVIDLEGVSSADVTVTEVATGMVKYSGPNTLDGHIVSNLAPGDYIVEAQDQVCLLSPDPITATVPALGTAVSLLTFTNDENSLAPSLDWISPSQGENITTRPVQLLVNAFGDCVDRVDYSLGQTHLGTSFNPPFSFAWSPNIANNGQDVELRARVTDTINRTSEVVLSIDLNISAAPLEVIDTYDLGGFTATVPVEVAGDIFIGSGRNVQRISENGVSTNASTDGIVTEMQKVNNIVYAVDDTGVAYRIDSAATLTAVKLWEPDDGIGGLLTNGGGRVFAASELELNAVANVSWQSPFVTPDNFRFNDIVASEDGTVVYAGAFRTIYALDASTGALVAQQSVPDSAGVRHMIFAFGRLWVAASNRNIYSFNQDFTSEQDPTLITDMCSRSTMVNLSAGSIWVTGTGGCLYRIDGSGNATSFSVPGVFDPFESAFASGAYVYIINEAGTVYAVNNDSSLSLVDEAKPAGNFKPAGRIVVANGKIYVPFGDRKLYVLESF